jgi:hypothetical protein
MTYQHLTFGQVWDQISFADKQAVTHWFITHGELPHLTIATLALVPMWKLPRVSDGDRCECQMCDVRKRMAALRSANRHLAKGFDFEDYHAPHLSDRYDNHLLGYLRNSHD